MKFPFGEGHYGLRVLLAFLVVLGLIGFLGWLVRRSGRRLAARQPRLAVLDATTVDGRRHLSPQRTRHG